MNRRNALGRLGLVTLGLICGRCRARGTGPADARKKIEAMGRVIGDQMHTMFPGAIFTTGELNDSWRRVQGPLIEGFNFRTPQWEMVDKDPATTLCWVDVSRLAGLMRDV